MKPALRVAVVVAAVWATVPLLMRADAPTQSGAAETQLRLAALLAAEGKASDAFDAYSRVLVVGDPALQATARKGMIRAALCTANFPVAAEQSALLMRTLPHDPEVLSLHGDALWAGGLFADAAAAYGESAALDPRQARAHRGVARCLAGQSRLAEALGEALFAVALAPGDLETHQTLGAVYERLRRYPDAVREFSAVQLLPLKDTSPQAILLRSQVAYLHSFGNRMPYEIRQPRGVQLHTVRFREVRGKVVVQARVNGSDLTDFVVDTGAERTVISRRTAQRNDVASVVSTISAGVGEIGMRGLEVGTIRTLEIGSLRIDNLPCLIKNPPLTGMPTREEDSISPPALGLSMRIDYKGHTLTIGSGLPEEPADFELPLYLNRLVTVRGMVDNARAANFIVDTGGELISISSATARLLNRPPDARRIPLKVYGISGWDRDAYLLPGVDLAFDAIRFRNFPVVVLNLEAPSVLLGYQLGGIVGRSFLSKYRVDVDLERSVLRLKELS
jgi:predicted aspartyl protease/Flp pilus assembly protein TadD